MVDSPRDKTALTHLELELLTAGDEGVDDRNKVKDLFGDRSRRRRLALVEERRTSGRVVAIKVFAIAETSRAKCWSSVVVSKMIWATQSYGLYWVSVSGSYEVVF